MKYRRGISSARGYTKGVAPARCYYFVGRLTNDYAGATFVKTKKTLSLNHKEPLPEARTSHIIHGAFGPRVCPLLFLALLRFSRTTSPSRDLSSNRGRFPRVYLSPNVPPFFARRTLSLDEFCRREHLHIVSLSIPEI